MLLFGPFRVLLWFQGVNVEKVARGEHCRHNRLGPAKAGIAAATERIDFVLGAAPSIASPTLSVSLAPRHPGGSPVNLPAATTCIVEREALTGGTPGRQCAHKQCTLMRHPDAGYPKRFLVRPVSCSFLVAFFFSSVSPRLLLVGFTAARPVQ